MTETERLILRHWEESDAASLYECARDPDVGPRTGWPPHKSIDESMWVIQNVLNGPECYAICLKEDNKAVGTIELKLRDKTELTDRDDECELGYWLGKPLWGKGIMPEAAHALLERAFGELGMRAVWCTYSEGNHNSMRVQQKCGFRYVRTDKGVDVPMLGEKRTHYVNIITVQEWREIHPVS